MKKRIFLLFLVLTPLLGTSSHIVGGEFELIHITGFQYKLNMVLYFDELNGAPGAKDLGGENIRIYRMFDNFGMLDVHLTYIGETSVDYTQPSCSHGELKTTRILYSADILLSPDVFNHPAGYYITWERCCRNYTITNIFSQNPSTNWAGQTFYLEFPPVVKDGQPFVDSTPRLFPPLNDFACPRRPYYTDFGGIDDDGDSLVYSLVTPLSTVNNFPVPPLDPRPYPDVRWKAPFGLNNIMNGAPDLRISRDGFLTVTPTSQGLFVFAVKVEEFRNKAKIGETRRDFQMLVVDACPRAVPPQVVGKKLNDVAYTYHNIMNVSFDNSVVDGQRCIKVQVSDADSQSPDDNFQERITIKAFAMNFKKDLSGILPTVTTATLINGSTAEFTICFPACPFLVGGDPQIGIIAMDDACSLPLTDTLKVNVHVEPPANRKPYFTTPNITGPQGTLNEGAQGAWPYVVKDDDGDPLVISLITNGFALNTAGMTFNTFHQTNGAADGEIKWDAFCNIYDFTKRTAFQITVQVEDQDKCLIPNPAKAIYNLTVVLPGNADPIIDTDLTPAPSERYVKGLTRRINESLKFKVTGKDNVDNDYLIMTGKGSDFSYGKYGVVIDPVQPKANGLVNSMFQWDITCKSVDLKKKDTFDFQFIVVDFANKCRIYKADTVDVEVKILPPLNQPPMLSVSNNSVAGALSSNVLSMILGPPIELVLTGTDADFFPKQDSLTIELISKDGTVEPVGFTFKPVRGKSPLQTTLSWQPNCTIFENQVYENDYSFMFRIHDDHCLTAKKDSVTVKIKIKDVDGTDAHFLPPNFFSPNGDNVNDYFAMEIKDESTGELKNVLPNDNCNSQFEGVRIYNRWGNQIFQSTDRNFKWHGVGESAGVYYFFINYTKKEYRGSLSLRY